MEIQKHGGDDQPGEVTSGLNKLLGGTVEELIAVLETMPPKADVMVVWDGHMRTRVHFAWLARNGCVALTDYGDVVYGADELPEAAPTGAYWETPRR